MVTARYLTDKWLTPLREKLRAEGRQQAIAEVKEWNHRRLEAEKKGEPFDEPLPFT